ncbi:hypothetical protein OIO90_006112 [Microbotryomycetes sp. JL221]|nr:hypothetical protein OIO90_006112 [Microbotryomycetes sp. JL221]
MLTRKEAYGDLIHVHNSVSAYRRKLWDESHQLRTKYDTLEGNVQIAVLEIKRTGQIVDVARSRLEAANNNVAIAQQAHQDILERLRAAQKHLETAREQQKDAIHDLKIAQSRDTTAQDALEVAQANFQANQGATVAMRDVDNQLRALEALDKRFNAVTRHWRALPGEICVASTNQLGEAYNLLSEGPSADQEKVDRFNSLLDKVKRRVDANLTDEPPQKDPIRAARNSVIPAERGRGHLNDEEAYSPRNRHVIVAHSGRTHS